MLPEDRECVGCVCTYVGVYLPYHVMYTTPCAGCYVRWVGG
jgi:hypothetical protein